MKHESPEFYYNNILNSSTGVNNDALIKQYAEDNDLSINKATEDVEEYRMFVQQNNKISFF